jgi:hypothetical protein
MNEFGFWDYVTIGATFLIVAGYFALRIKKMLDPNSGGACGCGNKSGGCSVTVKEGCGSSGSKVASINITDNRSKSVAS